MPLLLSQDAPEAAISLLGAVVTTTINDERVSVQLTEVEAYMGADDPASHAFRSRTPRNDPMFRAAGTVYVYRSYGIHWCMNLVTGAHGNPQAVLLRGGEIIDGIDVAVRRRSRRDHLADGPGKFAQALGVTGELSGVILGEGPIGLTSVAAFSVPYRSSPRIGVSAGRELHWRFERCDEPSKHH